MVRTIEIKFVGKSDGIFEIPLVLTLLSNVMQKFVCLFVRFRSALIGLGIIRLSNSIVFIVCGYLEKES